MCSFYFSGIVCVFCCFNRHSFHFCFTCYKTILSIGNSSQSLGEAPQSSVKKTIFGSRLAPRLKQSLFLCTHTHTHTNTPTPTPLCLTHTKTETCTPSSLSVVTFLSLKGAFCKNWQPVEFIIQTNWGQHSTRKLGRPPLS